MISYCIRIFVRFRELALLAYFKMRYPSISIGNNCVIQWNTSIRLNSSSNIRLGDNILLRSNPKGYHAGMPFPTSLLLDGDSSLVSIGSSSRINGCYIHAKKSIEIGSNCVIAAGTNIIDSNGHVVNSKNRTRGRDFAKKIVIGNNVWIGLNCIILKGTYIGDNCIVAAGSVVKGHFEMNSLIVGNPAITLSQLEI